MSNDVIVLKLVGKAAPQGSKQSLPVRRKDAATGQMVPVYKNGRLVTTVKDDNPRTKPWKESCSWQAREQYDGPVLTGAVLLEMVFYMPRPKLHYGTGRNADLLKDSAPAYPAKIPDVGKLGRAVEDSLSGVVYADDALVVDNIARKRYVGRTEPPYVEVRIALAPAQTVSELVQHGLMEPIRPTAVEHEQLSLVAVLDPKNLPREGVAA